MIKVAKHFSHVGALIAVSTLVGCGGGAETKTDPTPINPQAPVSDWQLVWSDEFDGTSIDDQKWTHEVNCLGGGNAEKQCYTEDEANSFVSDGTLKIVALPAAEGAQQPYTSARMVTKNKADFKYGRFEIRAKLPSGQGSWPAFWLLPTDEVYGGWPKSGEIDIVEAVNLKAKDAEGNPESHVYGTLHYGKDWPDNVNSGKAYKLPDGANPADDFHDYAIIKINSDGKILYKKSVIEILIENEIFPDNFALSSALSSDTSPLYTNDIEPALSDSEYWQQGDVFISIRHQSAIVHYRPSTNKVINYITGPFAKQHDVDIISDKEISIFNNNNFLVDNEYSEVVIYNFETKKFRTLFNNQLKENNFKTTTGGLSHIFNDGSLMVEEQNHGRIILFNNEGEKEWEFVNKDKNGDIGSVTWSRIIEDEIFIEQFKSLVENKKCTN